MSLLLERRGLDVFQATILDAVTSTGDAPEISRSMELTMAMMSISANRVPSFDRFEHYQLNTGPTHEFGDLPERRPRSRTLVGPGQRLPYRCTHCYSMNARVKGVI